MEGVLPEHLAALLVESRESLGDRRYDLADLPDVLAREQEVHRIHVAGPDEASGLPGAAAGVGRVHEPARVVHEAVQVPARPGQSLPEVLGTDLQQLGAERVRDAEDLAEDIEHALLAVETEQHAGGAAQARLVHE